MVRGEGSGEKRARRTSVELRGVRFWSLSEELVLGGVSPCVIRCKGGDTGLITWGSVNERKSSSWMLVQVEFGSNCEHINSIGCGSDFGSIDRWDEVLGSSDGSWKANAGYNNSWGAWAGFNHNRQAAITLIMPKRVINLAKKLWRHLVEVVSRQLNSNGGAQPILTTEDPIFAS